MTPVHISLTCVLVLAVPPATLWPQGTIAAAIERHAAATSDPDVARLYRTRDYAPLWQDDSGRLNAASQVVLRELRHSTDHGLDSTLYCLPGVTDLMAQAAASHDPDVSAGAEMALTAALLRYLRDLRQGRARPASVPEATADADPVATLIRALAGDSLASLPQMMAPPFRQYRLLQAALARERTALRQDPADTGGAHRVERIVLALERLRWLPRIGAGRMIIVNVPAFELLAFDSPGGAARPELRSRVVVGDADRTRTPLLLGEMTMVEFWPYWNVPRSILLSEILPPLRQNPDYLRPRQMDVVNARGEVVGDQGTPEILEGLADGRYNIRQRPSRTNALGVVKFLFPNAASVYAHDTPSRELFKLDRRDFSHGCIRVEEAASLAEWVMADEPGWGRARVQLALRGPATVRIGLRQPIPVLIIYTTAVASPDGTMRYFDDVYQLDGALAEALRR